MKLIPIPNEPDWFTLESAPAARIHKSASIGPNCVIWGGVFHGGVFHGGVFWGGTFHGGVFWGGMFRGGEVNSALDHLLVGPIGTRSDVLTIVRDPSLPGHLRLTTGCWSGSLDEFLGRLSQPSHSDYLTIVPPLCDLLRGRMTPIEEAREEHEHTK